MKKYPPTERMAWAIGSDLSAINESGRDNARRVLCRLAFHADQHTLVTNVGIDHIANKLQITSMTVKRCLPKLEQAGLILIKRIRRYGNMYMLLLGDIDESNMQTVVEAFNNGRNLEQIKESLSNTLLLLRQGDEKGSLSNNLPPSKLQLGVPLTGERYKNRVNPTPCANHFDEFWNHYPKKVNKKKSAQIWERRNLDLMADQIIENVKTRAAGDDQWLRGYSPDPSTYLNGDRWEDEWQTQKRASNGYKSQADRAAENIERMLNRTAGNTSLDETGGAVPRLRVVSDD